MSQAVLLFVLIESGVLQAYNITALFFLSPRSTRALVSAPQVMYKSEEVFQVLSSSFDSNLRLNNDGVRLNTSIH